MDIVISLLAMHEDLFPGNRGGREDKVDGWMTWEPMASR